MDIVSPVLRPGVWGVAKISYGCDFRTPAAAAGCYNGSLWCARKTKTPSVNFPITYVTISDKRKVTIGGVRLRDTDYAVRYVLTSLGC